MSTAKNKAAPRVKTGAELIADFRTRKAQAGLKEVRNVWAHPDDHPDIKALADKLAARRERAARKQAAA